jgi:hypothetical protein
MFQFNKKFLFFVFALCLFTIGAKISLIIQNGLGKGNDLIFTILLLFSLIISSVILYGNINKAKKNIKSDE